MKILIVDDNAKIRLLLRDYLPDAVDEIYECSDGERALQLYKQYQPDWVLMDHEMPGMKGITAIREIIAEFPRAKICMITAFDDEEIRDEAFAAGVRGFVLKDNLSELGSIFAGNAGFEQQH